MESIRLFSRKVAACRRCDLCIERKRAVFGQGKTNRPTVMFIGEGPCTADEARGTVFTGKVGTELRRLCRAAGLSPSETYRTNICKCCPPNNRPPVAEEMLSCLPWLREQVAIIRPKVIVAFGLPAAAILVKSHGRAAKHLGRWSRFGGVPMLSTYHPAYLLRWPPARNDALADFKKVARRLAKDNKQL